MSNTIFPLPSKYCVPWLTGSVSEFQIYTWKNATVLRLSVQGENNDEISLFTLKYGIKNTQKVVVFQSKWALECGKQALDQLCLKSLMNILE